MNVGLKKKFLLKRFIYFFKYTVNKNYSSWQQKNGSKVNICSFNALTLLLYQYVLNTYKSQLNHNKTFSHMLT